MNVTIRKANKADLGAIAELHINAFPGFFLTKLGSSFLKLYYGAYEENGEPLIVAVNSNASIVGFVAGLHDSVSFYRFLKRHWYRFFFPVIGALLNPRLVSVCLTRIVSIFRFDKVNKQISIPKGFHELSSIAVSPAAQHSGVGRLLVGAFLETIKSENGDNGVFLTTDFTENDKVHRFYESMGFNSVGEFVQGKGRKMTAYSLSLKDNMKLHS